MNAPDARILKNEPGNGILPTKEFFSPEYFEHEKERIFKKSWLRVGREEQIPNVGDYFVQELEACDTSLIIVRGRDKRIRAFHNNCSHRNNRMAYEKTGNAGTAFRCRFHSWSYGLDGKLMAVPEEHHFPGLDKSQHGLSEVACESWEDFIYINVDPHPAQTLREYLGEEVYNGFGGFFKQYKQVHKMSAIVNCNWKASLDAFVETYHFSTVHALTAKDIVTSREYPNGKVDAFREFGKHRIVSVGANMAHEHTFTETLARKFSGNATLAGSDAARKYEGAAQINPESMSNWLTDILVVFPMANTQPLSGFFIYQNYWPLDHGKIRWELIVCMKPPQSAAGEAAVEYNRVLLIDLNREDLNNLEWVQKNLNAQTKNHQVLGEMEVMLRSAYKTVAKEIGYGW